MDAWLWLEAGLGHFMAGDPASLAELERATRSPGATAAHSAALIEVRRLVGDDEEALALGLRAMERYPHDARVATRTARVALDPPGAAALDGVIATDPARAVAWELRGAVRMAEGLPASAVVDLDRAAALGRDTPALAGMRAGARTALGQHDDALEILEVSTQRWPEHLGLVSERFVEAEATERPDAVLGAAEAWRVAASHHQAMLPAPVRLAAVEAALALDRAAEALAWAELVLAQEDAEPTALRARAQALVRLERGPEALRAFERALGLAPEDDHLLLAFAGFLLTPATGVDPDPHRAQDLVEEARRLRGEDDAQVHGLLAEARWALGDPAGAVEHQQSAVELDPSDTSLRKRLGQFQDAMP